MARFPFGRFFGNTVSAAAGTAAGTATAAALAPALQEEVNLAWSTFPNRPVGAGPLAAGVAQGQVDPKAAKAEARLSGYSGAAFDTMVAIANVGPPLGAALDAFRRGTLDPTEYQAALKRAGIEPEWFHALLGLRDARLSPETVANAVQQGHVPNDGILPPIVTEGPPFDIPLTTIDIDATDEAAAHGVDESRLKVLANLAGLPPAAGELREMLNRGYITPEAAVAGIREGHTKTKWTGPTLALRAAVLSATEAASARLRTWISKEEADAIGAMHGYTPEQMELLFLNRGRPASPTQMWRGWARKATGPRGVPVSYEDHAKAIAISDIRPEYAEMLWEIRYNYPPLFQLNRLVDAGAITPEVAAQWAEYNLEAPEVVAALLAYWKKGGTSGGKEATAANLRAEYEGLYIDRATLTAGLTDLGYSAHDADVLADLGDAARVKTYRDRVVTAIYKAFLAHKLTDAQARVALADDGIDAAAIGHLLDLWQREAGLTRHELTEAQIVAAYRRAVLSFDQALAELVERGRSDADARTLLGIAQTPLTDAETKTAYLAGTLSLADTRAALAASGHAAATIDQLIASWGPPPTPTP